MAKKSVSRQRPLWYRLLLIPYAALFYWLMGLFDLHTLDFLKRFMDFWGRDTYTLNFVCAFSWVLGLALLILGPAKNRLVTGFALLLFLMPIWLQRDVKMANEPDALRLEWNTLKFVFELSMARWALMLVRGEASTEWIKLILGLVLLAVSALAYLKVGDSLKCFELFVTILPLAALTGFAVDYVYNGFSLQALLPAAITILANLAVGFVSREVVIGGLALLSVAGILLLLIKKDLRKSAIGGAFTLFYILLNSAVIALSEFWMVALPKL